MKRYGFRGVIDDDLLRCDRFQRSRGTNLVTAEDHGILSSEALHDSVREGH
jgi:hypothetical protein